jgi:hypothetical protein
MRVRRRETRRKRCATRGIAGGIKDREGRGTGGDDATPPLENCRRQFRDGIDGYVRMSRGVGW